MRTRRLVIVAGTVLAGDCSLARHHDFNSEFDSKKPIKCGDGHEMEWINTARGIHVDVKNRTAPWKKWMIEAGRKYAVKARLHQEFPACGKRRSH